MVMLPHPRTARARLLFSAPLASALLKVCVIALATSLGFFRVVGLAVLGSHA